MSQGREVSLILDRQVMVPIRCHLGIVLGIAIVWFQFQVPFARKHVCITKVTPQVFQVLLYLV